MASTTSAAVLFQKPTPRTVKPNAISTTLGNARPMLATLAANRKPRWR